MKRGGGGQKGVARAAASGGGGQVQASGGGATRTRACALLHDRYKAGGAGGGWDALGVRRVRRGRKGMVQRGGRAGATRLTPAALQTACGGSRRGTPAYRVEGGGGAREARMRQAGARRGGGGACHPRAPTRSPTCRRRVPGCAPATRICRAGGSGGCSGSEPWGCPLQGGGGRVVRAGQRAWGAGAAGAPPPVRGTLALAPE